MINLIFSLFLYGLLGGLLGHAGINAMEDWQFWAIMLVVMFLNILTYSRCRKEYRSMFNTGEGWGF